MNDEQQIVVQTKLANQIPMSLEEYLNAITAIDDESITLSDEELKKLLTGLELKVDSYAFRKTYLEAAEKFLDERIDEIYKAKKAVQMKMENLKRCIVIHMETHGFEKLPGQQYKVRIQEKDTTSIVGEPSALELNNFPELVRVEYSWRKKEAVDAYKSGEFRLEEFIEKRKTKFPVFTVNTEPKQLK